MLLIGFCHSIQITNYLIYCLSISYIYAQRVYFSHIFSERKLKPIIINNIKLLIKGLKNDYKIF